MLKQSASLALVNSIINILHPFRRQFTLSCPHHDDPTTCYSPHIEKLTQQIEKASPLTFVLPAFPAKSPNRQKTLGTLPDLGEQLSLQFLNNLCERIAKVYAPGVCLWICSDGRVFNDLVKVSDEDVSAYTKAINHMIKENQLHHLKQWGLDECYQAISFSAMREQLLISHGESIETIKAKIAANPHEKMLFNGIHRFLFEDECALAPDISKNQHRKVSKALAYQVIQRSNAWSSVVEKYFPDAMRLSIHPQACGSKKFGIRLLKSKHIWATPWHRVVLFDGQDYQLVRKIEAEQLGAKYVNNHYIL